MSRKTAEVILEQSLQIEKRSVSSLKMAPKNPRTHSRKQLHQIAASIREFGFNNPILIDPSGEVIAGHGRLEAAKYLGLESVPIIQLAHLTEAQKRAFAIADNKIALNAAWDLEILASELQFLADGNVPFEIETTGFETAEIDIIIDGVSGDVSTHQLDRVPDRPSHTTTMAGDLWLLGDHKLLCADTRDPSSFELLMGRERARVVFSDPPFNVPVDGHVCGLGSIKHREFAMASGEMSRDEFVAFLKASFTNTTAVSVDGALHYVCMDWRHIEEVLAAGKSTYSELKNICVWNKSNAGMGSLYRSKHELVLVFKAGTAAHLNTIELGRNGRYRTNVWDYPGATSLDARGRSSLAMHPTVKPTAMVMDAIKDCSRRGDIVLDPFGGSGTTIIAAQKCGRKARVVEIDTGYVDVAIRRWEELTGGSAIQAATQLPFRKLATDRATASAPSVPASNSAQVKS